VARRDIVRVVLSKQQREILRQISEKLGQSESEVLRMAFMEYAKSISLVTEKVHGRT
jgi:DnaJ-domain-containing protein 1